MIDSLQAEGKVETNQPQPVIPGQIRERCRERFRLLKVELNELRADFVIRIEKSVKQSNIPKCVLEGWRDGIDLALERDKTLASMP